MDAALEEVLTFRQICDRSGAALKDSSLGHRDVLKSAGTFWNGGLSDSLLFRNCAREATTGCDLSGCQSSFSSALNNRNSRRDVRSRQSSLPLSVLKVFSIRQALKRRTFGAHAERSPTGQIVIGFARFGELKYVCPRPTRARAALRHL